MTTRRSTGAGPVPGPTLTVLLSGGPHLTELISCSVRAVHTVSPESLGPSRLQGPFLRVNGARRLPMNVPTPFGVAADAKAVYVHARSAHGAAHDVHVALAPESGAVATIPLTTVTPAKRAAHQRLDALLTQVPYVFAHTMPENPHCYTRRDDWANDADYLWAIRAIRTYGWRQRYTNDVGTTYTETVYDIGCGDVGGGGGAHFVWSGFLPPEQTHWINRKLRTHEPAILTDQTLVVDGARRLPIPPLPLDFAGLDPSITQCPFFRAQVALWGWPVPDLRPRLRRRR